MDTGAGYGWKRTSDLVLIKSLSQEIEKKRWEYAREVFCLRIMPEPLLWPDR